MGAEITGGTTSAAGGPTINAKRMDGLDLLRFFLALGVMWLHFFFALPEVYFVHDAPEGARAWVFARYTLEVFFIISGMVIFQTGRTRSFVDFWVNRLVRLIPTMFVCATLTVAVTKLFPVPNFPYISLVQWVASVLTVPLALKESWGVDWSYWTLTYEMRFYLLASVFFMFVHSMRDTIAALAIWLAATFLASLTQSPVLETLTLAKAAPCFIFGILITLHMTQPGWRRSIYAIGAGSVALMPWQMMIAVGRREAWQAITWPEALVTTVALLAALFGFLAWRNAGRFRAITLACGSASFPLYVLHYFIGTIIILHLYHAGVPWVWSVLAASAVVIALAFVVSQLLAPAIGKHLDAMLRALVPLLGRLVPRPLWSPLTTRPVAQR